MLLFTAFSATVSADESATDSSGVKLEIVPDDPYKRKPEIELNTEYTVTVPDGSSEDEAYYAYFNTKDNRMYFVLSGKNISMPTENGLAKIQILDSNYNPVFGIGMAEGYEHNNAQKLNSYSRYYIKFFSDDKSSLNGGEMTFSLSTVPDPESDNFDNTTALEKGETREGNIAVPRDVDCFSFSKSNQEEFKCVIEPQADTALLAELYTYDYDSETAQLVTSATSDEVITIISRNASPDEYVSYRLKISSINGGTGNYEVRYNDVRLYTDFQLNYYLSTSLGGYGEDTGTDYIRFTTAHKDAYYRIPIYNTDIKTGKTADEYLQAELLDENFALIDKISVEEGGSNRILAKLSPDKVYYVKVYNGFSQDTEGGRYAVRIMYDFDEDRGERDYAFEKNLGEVISGKVETSYDNDWFKLTTSDSTRYLLVLENKSEEVIVEKENGYLEIKSIRAVIVDENGQEIETAIASGEYICIKKVDLKPNTTYYIRVYDPSATIADYDVALVERLILGDVDLDEKIKIQDATLIQKFIAKLADIEEKGMLTADVTEDGKVNIKDATAIQKFLAKIETTYKTGQLILSEIQYDEPASEPTEPSSVVLTEPITTTAVADKTEPTAVPTTAVTEPTEVVTDATEATTVTEATDATTAEPESTAAETDPVPTGTLSQIDTLRALNEEAHELLDEYNDYENEFPLDKNSEEIQLKKQLGYADSDDESYGITEYEKFFRAYDRITYYLMHGYQYVDDHSEYIALLSNAMEWFKYYVTEVHPEPVSGPRIIYLDNALGWESPHIYFWNSESGEHGPLWPGMKMTERGSDYFTCEVPREFDRIVFCSTEDSKYYSVEIEIDTTKNMLAYRLVDKFDGGYAYEDASYMLARPTL